VPPERDAAASAASAAFVASLTSRGLVSIKASTVEGSALCFSRGVRSAEAAGSLAGLAGRTIKTEG